MKKKQKMEVNQHCINWVNVISLEKVLKKMKLELLNFIKSQPKRNIWMLNMNLVVVMIMESELMLINLRHLNYFKLQLKEIIVTHKKILEFYMKMEKVLQ